MMSKIFLPKKLEEVKLLVMSDKIVLHMNLMCHVVMPQMCMIPSFCKTFGYFVVIKKKYYTII
jgi:hypothetical protein